MEKSLILLGILIISGATVSSVIAASFHEKQEIKDVNYHLKTNENTGKLDRNKRSSEDDDFPNVSDIIKEMLTKHWISINKKNGKNLTSHDFSLDLDIKVASVHQMIPNGTIEENRRMIASDSRMIVNSDDFEQKLSSSEITLNTTITESWKISNTFDITGELEIPSIPLINSEEKIGFKLSRSGSAKTTESEEISRKIPSPRVKVKPHSGKRIKSDFYAIDVTYKYLLTFKINENSTYSVIYKEMAVDEESGLQILGKIVTPVIAPVLLDEIKAKIDGKTVNGINLKESLESYVLITHKKYPTTVYDGSIPCIEFRDNEIYISYFPLKIQRVKLSLERKIEDPDN